VRSAVPFSRVIPILLYSKGRLVKSVNFSSPTYVGDPINAIRIFNAKEVDELIILDIEASKEKQTPNFGFIASIVDECFMPLCYGGGVRSIEDMDRLFNLGIEKISLNDILFDYPELISQAATRYGRQSIVCSIDVCTYSDERRVYRASTGEITSHDPVSFALSLETFGAGEILLNSVDKDGTQQGYDLDLVHSITERVVIPVVAAGGAGKAHDLLDVLQTGASAAAAGSLFVFKGPHKAVLLSYLSQPMMSLIGKKEF
jgi:cyclase